jgi:hypothetical protein
MGTMHIKFDKNSEFTLFLGNLHSMATASKEVDSMRVKFMPIRGQSITFSVIDKQVNTLTYGGFVFTKQTDSE